MVCVYARTFGAMRRSRQLGEGETDEMGSFLVEVIKTLGFILDKSGRIKFRLVAFFDEMLWI